MEIWKAIPGFDHYEVSDQGRIRTVPFTVVRSNGSSRCCGNVGCRTSTCVDFGHTFSPF